MADVMSFSFENEGNGEFGNGDLQHDQEESFRLNENDAEAQTMIDGGTGDDDTFSGLGDPNFDFNSSASYPSSILSENLFGTESSYVAFDSAGQGLRNDHTYPQSSLSPLSLPPNPSEADGWQKRLEAQIDVYKAQTRDFHRLVATQKLLTGVDPLTGQMVDLRTAVKPEGAPAPRPAVAVPGMKPELLAVFLQFLNDNPKPTKKDLKQLLPQVNMGEKEAIEALRKVRKAKQDHERKSRPQETTKATESPEVHAWSITLLHVIGVAHVSLVRCFERFSSFMSDLRRVMMAYAGPTFVGTGRWQTPLTEQLHRLAHARAFLLYLSTGQRLHSGCSNKH